jgi:hypothetical protein
MFRKARMPAAANIFMKSVDIERRLVAVWH